jgi:hypothetical protein
VAFPRSPERTLWVTRSGTAPASHEAALASPAVKAAVATGRPLIAGFSNRVETVLVGGLGLL